MRVIAIELCVPYEDDRRLIWLTSAIMVLHDDLEKPKNFGLRLESG